MSVVAAALPPVELKGRRPARPWLAAILSLLVPGAGHLYAWRPMLAVTAWSCSAVAGAALVAVLLAAPNAIAIAAALGAFAVLYIAIAVHAFRTARESCAIGRPRAWILAALVLTFVVISGAVGSSARQWAGLHVARAYRIASSSMEPSLLVGDWLLATPRRGSIEHDRVVVYRRAGELYIKRAVGLAGDTLAMRDRRLFRNGQPVHEPYASYDRSRVSAHAATWGPLPVPARKVFVMGDNRNHAADSRYFGFVDVDGVVAYPARIYFSRDPITAAIRWGRIGRGFR